jgi:anaerobic selenocysteine-containing dehydrogenase
LAGKARKESDLSYQIALESSCPLDCPDNCSLLATVEQGKLVKLRGSQANPLTAGLICGKVSRFSRRLYGPARILRPHRRVGPKGAAKFQPISWEQAMEELVEKVSGIRHEFGGEAILPCCYGGSNGLVSQDGADAWFFARAGATQIRRDICATPSGRASAALYGGMPGIAFPDYAHADLILLWGSNPPATHFHLVSHIKAAQRKGARLVVLDPRRTPLAASADLHLAIRPGTDLPVALSLIHWLFEANRADEAFLEAHATGVEQLRAAASSWTLERAAAEAEVDPAALRHLAELYADSEVAAIRCGWGPERNRNGGSAVAAILALPAVAGKFGVRGGGFTMSNSGAWNFDCAQALNCPSSSARYVSLAQTGRSLTELKAPPIKLLLVYNCNPLSTLPDQRRLRKGLLREDLFTVVHEQVWTDTARFADLVLPATTFLEHTEISRGYGSYSAQVRPAVVAPVGEARSNYRLFSELGQRVFGEAPPPLEKYQERLLEGLSGEARKALVEGAVAAPGCGQTPIQMVDVFPTTLDQSIHLFPPRLAGEGEHELYQYLPDPSSEAYPLALITPASKQRTNSTFGELSDSLGVVEMHPEDAAFRKLCEGQLVRVFNLQGETQLRLSLRAGMRQGVVAIEKGLWKRHCASEWTPNVLVPDTLSDFGRGACYNDARVEVSQLETQSSA